MGRWIILALCAALAVASYNEEPGYRPGREYVYKYDTQSLSGIPEAGNQWAGIRLLCDVRLQMRSSGRVTAKFENVQLCKIHDDLNTLSPEEPLPQNLCEEVEGPEAATTKQQLEKPFQFKWVAGLVEELEVDPEVYHQSVNLIRGFLHVINLDMQERNKLPEVPEEIESVLHLSGSPRTEFTSFYQTKEQGPVGKCVSVIGINESPEESPSRMYLTKVRDYERCDERPYVTTGYMTGFNLTQTETMNLVKTKCHGDYQLTGHRRHFLIEEAKVVSTHILQPWSEQLQVGTSKTITMQKLKLTERKDAGYQISLPRQLTQKPALKLELPERVSGQWQPPRDMPEEQVQEKAEKIRELLEVIVPASPETPLTYDSAEKTAILSTLLKELPTQKLQELVLQIVSEGVQTEDPMPFQKKELLLDILTVCDRTDTIPVWKRLLEQDLITKARAAFSINYMSLTTQPDLQLILDLLSLYKERIVEDNTQLKRAVILSAGSLVNTLEKMYKQVGVPQGTVISARHSIVQKMRQLLETAGSEDEQIAIIKAIGNTGVVEFLPVLERIATDSNKNPDIRAKAIYSLRNMTPLVKRKVMLVCMPLYLDPNQPEGVRIAAFIMTMHTNPNYGVIQMIVHNLKKERSLNTGSFVYTYLESLVRSSGQYDNHNRTSHIKLALRSVKPFLPGFQYSKSFRFSLTKELLNKYGPEILLDMVNTDVQSIIPDDLIATIAGRYKDMHKNILSVGLETKGLHTLLRNLIGPEGMLEDLLKGRVSVADILEPITSRTRSSLSAIRDIMNKISLTERRLSTVDAKMFIKVFNQELRYFHFDKDYLVSLIQKAENYLPELVEKLNAGLRLSALKTFSVVNTGITLPTPSGMTVSFNTTTVNMFSIQGNVRTEGLPSIYQLFRLSGRPTFNIRTDLKASMVSETFSGMGCSCGCLKTFSGIQHRMKSQLPIKSNIEVSGQTLKVKANLELPQEETELVHQEFKPITFVLRRMCENPDQMFKMEKKEINSPQIITPRPVDATFGESCKMAMYGQMYKTLTPTAPFCCKYKHDITLALRPGSDMPTHLEAEFAYINDRTPSPQSVKESVLSPSDSEESSYSSESSEDSWFSSSYRTQRRGRQSVYGSRQFSPVQPPSDFQQPTFRQIIAVIRTKGDSNPRSIQMQVTHTCDKDWLKHKHNTQIISSPITQSQTSPIKVELDNEIRIPTKWFTAGSGYSSGDDTFWKSELFYGPLSSVERCGAVKGIYGYREPPPVPSSWYSSWYPIWEETPAYSAPALPSLVVEVDFDFNVIPTCIYQRGIENFHNLMKYLYPDSKLAVKKANNPPNKFVVTTTCDTDKDLVIVEADFLHETDIVTFPIPYYPVPKPNAVAPKPGQPILEHFLLIASGKKIPATCDVRSAQVKTFDLVSYELPDTDCEAVLTKDCAKPSFVVTIKKSPETGKKKKVPTATLR